MAIFKRLDTDLLENCREFALFNFSKRKLYPSAYNYISDGYTTDDITYLWKEVDPVQIAQNLNLPRFSIEEYGSTYCNVKTNTGTYYSRFSI